MAVAAKKKARKRNVVKVPPLPPPKYPYDRQPEDTTKGWAAFCVFRDMGPQRSCAKVANELGLHSVQVEHWSRRFRWQERIQHWQRAQDDAFAAARSEHLNRMAKRHVAIAMTMQDKLYARIKTISPDNLTPREVAQWVKVATDLERVALGAPANTIMLTGTVVTQQSPGQLTQEERLREIERLQQRRAICGTD